MDVSAIIELVNNVGVVAVVLFASMYYVKYTGDKARDERQQLTEAHKAEMSEITNALNNNTVVMQKLCDKLEMIGGASDERQ